MRLDFSLLARGDKTGMGSNAQSGLTRDRASEQAGHTDAAEITTLNAAVTLVTAETATFSMKRAEWPGLSSAPSDPDKSGGMQSTGHSGHSGHSLYLCGDSPLSTEPRLVTPVTVRFLSQP